MLTSDSDLASGSAVLSSDLTFLTNEPGSTLLERFATLLRKDTRFFDCLVGYFFVSGFHRIYRYLENVEKIRILVGLRTDAPIYNLLQQAKAEIDLSFKSHTVTAEQMTAQVRRELEHAPDTALVESGVLRFVEWVKLGKLEIRAYPTENLHAKVYIMTFGETDRDRGRVITGSSNLSQSGLQKNLEFNVELKMRSDYDFAFSKFNELWKNAVDVSRPYEDTILKDSLYASFTPYELYLKFLYEYFKNELSRSEELRDLYVPLGFKRLKYQEEAILNARKILDEYGGVFLSDVVGLGKTYMSALLAQQLDGRCLVIAPPHLLDRDRRGSWPNVFGDFQVRQTDFVSIGRLDDLLSRDLSKYSNVFIDESHRFRTESTATYEKLAQICRGKRVILVSATPLNNRPSDILSQLKLFQNGRNSTIPNLRNLDAFFTSLERQLDGLDRQQDHDRYFQTVQSNAKQIREKVLKYLMIRRTRTEIERYYGDDIRAQGLKFPLVEAPEPLFYRFDKAENHVFDETIKLLAKNFTFARYRPLTYYRGDITGRELQGQRNLATFMKILIVKRLESSFAAFRLTLGRFIRSYERVIHEYERGNVYISKTHTSKIFDLLEVDDQESIEQLLAEDKAERLSSVDFSPDFFRDLKSDLLILRRIQAMWADIKRDPKWEALRDLLRNAGALGRGKIIIFTESQETAGYLCERIAEEVDTKVISFSGASDEEAHKEVMTNFDANAFRRRDDYRILISTDVLSEGVNLHRSNIVINYDIPWNPTRLIQRVGRVNRVDTKFDAIRTYNFFPTQEANDVIKLREAAEAKIHAFIEMLGSDARLLTEGEDVKSHDLFAKLTSKQLITGEDEEEPSELEYLGEIRDVRDGNPDLFGRIKRLPKKARSTRIVGDDVSRGDMNFPSLVTYFRQGKLDKFFLASEGGLESRELDFIAAVGLLRPLDLAEARRAIPERFYDLLEKNKAAFAGSTAFDDTDAAVRHKGSTHDRYILKRLRAKQVSQYHGYTEEDELFIGKVIQLLNDGALPRPTSKRVAERLRDEIEPLNVLGVLRRHIPAPLFEPTRAQAATSPNLPREVILSSYLFKT